MTNTVKRQFEKMRSGKGFRTPKLAGIQSRKEIASLDQKIAVPIYYLGLGELKDKKDVSTAKHVSWRYLIKHKGKEVASADAFIDKDGTSKFSHVNEGPLVSGLVSALKIANSEAILQRNDFEVRILMVPALYVAALWLVDSRLIQDYVVPFEPSPANITANRLVMVDRFIRTLHGLAERVQLGETSFFE